MAAPEPIEILLLTQEDCALCSEAKALLDRLAGEYPLSVTTCALASPAGEALVRRGGIMFPPGIFLDGEPFCYGRPSERKLRRTLQRQLALS